MGARGAMRGDAKEAQEDMGRRRVDTERPGETPRRRGETPRMHGETRADAKGARGDAKEARGVTANTDDRIAVTHLPPRTSIITDGVTYVLRSWSARSRVGVRGESHKCILLDASLDARNGHAGQGWI